MNEIETANLGDAGFSETDSDFASLDATIKRSDALWDDLPKNPHKYRVLTGDRPTGFLHIGHYFGTLKNRIKIQNLGVTSFIIIADYQVLYDRDSADNIGTHVRECVTDYLAAGLDPGNGRTFIFCHSYVPELNQLMVPFLLTVSMPELDRNPTVKEEIRAAGMRSINALTFTYPVHQAADILFCKGNIVPVGKDQLPHLEITRKIARRFNERFSPKKPIFPIPDPLLSEMPMVLGLDGSQKMSKSQGNCIYLKHTDTETAKLIKGAKTDSDRLITYEPDKRPEVANMLRLISMCTDKTPQEIASEIGDAGAGKLKQMLADSLNAHLAPVRAKRKELEKDQAYIISVLENGVAKAREEAQKTLKEVRESMKMNYGLKI